MHCLAIKIQWVYLNSATNVFVREDFSIKNNCLSSEDQNPNISPELGRKFSRAPQICRGKQTDTMDLSFPREVETEAFEPDASSRSSGNFGCAPYNEV